MFNLNCDLPIVIDAATFAAIAQLDSIWGNVAE